MSLLKKERYLESDDVAIMSQIFHRKITERFDISKEIDI